LANKFGRIKKCFEISMIKNNIKKYYFKKYFLAGIDFLIDKNGDVYFIEANSSPGLLRFFEREYKHVDQLKI
jgi:glutathione synthase/RimK-type ligase-like ATP-grasp enzyme